jgi:hypothetical protein
MMRSNKQDQLSLAVLWISHGKATELKISQELVKNVWQRDSFFEKCVLYHVTNSSLSEYPRKYLENVLLRKKNSGHIRGAADLINAGIAALLQSSTTFDYFLIMSGDVWLSKPDQIKKILTTMKAEHSELATTLWPLHLGTEFFIISPTAAAAIFPLDITTYLRTHPLLQALYNLTKNLPTGGIPILEMLYTEKTTAFFGQSLFHLVWSKKVFLLHHRPTMLGFNRFYTRQLGYYSHHNVPKKLKLFILDNSHILSSRAYPTLTEVLPV